MRIANCLVLTAALVLSACTSTPQVTTDRNPSAPFSSYRTYTWLSKPDNMAPLMQQRLVDSVDAQLRKMGWTESANADVAIAGHAVLSQKQRLDTMYSGSAYRGWGGGWGGGMGSSTTTVRTYDVGTLIIDLFDTKTRQGVWRGTASGTLTDSPETRSAKIQTAVEKMFSKFPDSAE
jgi:hypothetical protein